MRFRVSALAVATLVTLVAAKPPAARADGEWPFGGGLGGRPTRGGPDAGGARPSMGRDWWNLGLLGVKASDPGYVDTAVRETDGSRTSVRPADRGDGRPAWERDGGPARFRVEALCPGGPALKAGLRIGDVITGTGDADFPADGGLGPLADALLRAESGEERGALRLRVLRGGGGEPTVVSVPIPVMGKEALEPSQGKAREAILRAALAFLAERQQGGGYPETLSGHNGAVVQAALAGLAWLGGGSDLSRGKHAKNVQGAFEFVGRWKGKDDFPGGGALAGMGTLDQSNWGTGHAAMFFGELAGRARSQKIREPLFLWADMLAERQEKSGGWAHGPGGKNPLGYVELNILTGVALCGMGAASQAGWKPPEGVLARAEEFLRRSSSPEGGVGYADAPGQAGQGNIGRTAACWLGYRALGLGDHPWTALLRGWTNDHVDEVLDGHASLMQHILFSGVAAHSLGAEARERWWKRMRRDLVLARAPDGSLQPRPWHESLLMGSNTDVSFGEIWTTAAWAIVLGCEKTKDRPGLPVLCPPPTGRVDSGGK